MNIFRTTTIALVAMVLFASPAMASRLFGPSVTPKRTIVAPASEVSVRVATPDYTLLPSLAAQATDTTGNPTFTLDLFDDVEVTAEIVRTEPTAERRYCRSSRGFRHCNTATRCSCRTATC